MSIFAPAPDYAQIELRILAHFSADAGLIEALRGGDVFRAIAGRLYRLVPDQVSGEQRERAKRALYGLIYGQFPPALAEGLRISVDAAKQLTADLHVAFPGLRRFEERVRAQARAVGSVDTLSGRRRYVRGLDSSDFTVRSRAERQVLNSVVQGSAADVLKNAMIGWCDGLQLIFFSYPGPIPLPRAPPH